MAEPAAAIEAITGALLSHALARASRSHAAAALNIANAGTPGFQPLAVRFDDSLEAAAAQWRQAGIVPEQDLPRAAMAPADSLVPVDGSVRLDEQLAGMAANAVRYQALLQGLSRHLGLLALAASEGRK